MKFIFVLELDVEPVGAGAPGADAILQEHIRAELDAAPLGPWTVKGRKYELVDWVITGSGPAEV